jgi:hypothetical protein
MDKMMEFYDAWMKSQKELMDSSVKAQKEFIDNLTETTKKVQETFLNMGIPQEGPMKEPLNLYKSWFTTMANSSKVFTDEAGRLQETWKNALEKQMDMGREAVKNFSEVFNKAA